MNDESFSWINVFATNKEKRKVRMHLAACLLLGPSVGLTKSPELPCAAAILCPIARSLPDFVLVALCLEDLVSELLSVDGAVL